MAEKWTNEWLGYYTGRAIISFLIFCYYFMWENVAYFDLERVPKIRLIAIVVGGTVGYWAILTMISVIIQQLK